MVKNHIISFLLLFLFITACQEESDDLIKELPFVVHSIKSYDIGNTASPLDLVLNLKVRPLRSITQLNLYLAPAKYFSDIENIDANSLASAPHTTHFIGGDGSSEVPPKDYLDWKIEIRFPSTFKDILGNNITTDQEYLILVEVVASNTRVVSFEKGRVTLKNIHPFTGHYISTDGQMSMALDFKDQSMQGTLYYSNKWEPCCGGTDDGTVNFKINIDGSISDVNMNFHLDNYLNEGAYEFSYFGEGQVDTYKQLTLVLSGVGEFTFVK